MELVVLDPQSPHFPEPDTALDEPDGLLAAGGNLLPDTVYNAYYNGIFPWYGDQDPILWWSPSTRCVINPKKLHVSKSLQKQLRKQVVTVSFDRAFDQIIQACAHRESASDTWINADMIVTYTELYKCGKAHSVEIWEGEKLIGGAYGVAVGRIFCGESMFSSRPNGSKIALFHLCNHLNILGYTLIDCQLVTNHLISMGGQSITRERFLEKLQVARDYNLNWHNHYQAEI